MRPEERAETAPVHRAKKQPARQISVKRLTGRRVDNPLKNDYPIAGIGSTVR